MPVEISVVDAFASVPFTGNPAAVAVVERFPPDHLMQLVAREMNLSETAFARPRPDGDYDLRWFTPAAEVDLCGHATLATAHVLGDEVTFHTRSGRLHCRAAAAGWIDMDFPADRLDPYDFPLDLGVEVEAAHTGRFDVLAHVADAAWLRSWVADQTAIGRLERRGLILTAAGDRPGIDFISRFFAPSVGVPEDPVTGSAHCTLAPYWSGRLGRPDLVGYQASARGGVVRTSFVGDRVRLAGQAVTVAEVRMLVDLPAG